MTRPQPNRNRVLMCVTMKDKSNSSAVVIHYEEALYQVYGHLPNVTCNHWMPSSPTWSLTDVCGSLDILPAAHHKRTTTVLSLR